MKINKRSAFPGKDKAVGRFRTVPRPGCLLLRYPSSRPTRCRLPRERLYISSIRIHQLVYRRAPTLSGALLRDASGALYGVASNGGPYYNGTVFKLTPPALGQTNGP